MNQYFTSDQEYETSSYSESDDDYLDLYNRNGTKTPTQDEYQDTLMKVKDHKI